MFRSNRLKKQWKVNTKIPILSRIKEKDGTARIVFRQWIAVVYGAGIAIGLLMFLTRRLGPADLAVYLYITAIASLYAIIQDGGYQLLIFREEASPTQQFGVHPIHLVSGYFGYLIPVTLIGILGIIVLPTSHKTGFIFALGYFALRCITNIISSVLKGRGDFAQEALWKMKVHTFLALPVLLLVGLTSPGPEMVFGGFIIGQIMVLATRTARDTLTRPQWFIPSWRIWKTCMAFIVINAATVVYYKTDIVLLKHLQGDLVLVGYYGAAFQLLDGVILLATPIVHLCFLSLRLNWLEKTVLLRKLSTMLVWTILAALAITGMGYYFAPKAILLAYGETYAASASFLPILLLALFFLLPNYILSQGLVAMNKERYFAFCTVFCAIFNVAANIVLIPHYQAMGAAWSTVATEIILFVLLVSRLYRETVKR